jgi:hypothetical protein
MIGHRTFHSFAQFLELQPSATSTVLLSKHSGQHVELHQAFLLSALLSVLRSLDERVIMEVLAEVVATEGNLRARVSPKHLFTERMHDLTQCLLLDGYIIVEKKLLKADPSISGAAPVEDDLVQALQNSGAPRRDEIIARINDSASSFRSTPPDFNASLVNARVALETLAGDVAMDVAHLANAPVSYDPTKWGSVIQFLRTSGEITPEEEKGLAGVFGFLSAGAHRPIGIPEDQMARLGRSFALNMCWFLLKNHTARI